MNPDHADQEHSVEADLETAATAPPIHSESFGLTVTSPSFACACLPTPKAIRPIG
jgi:hypothetical protein